MMGLSSGKRVQVSTVNSPSDEFMKSYSRGTKSGFDKDGKKVGTIALFQPTFFNYEEIDIERSLYEQELEPARPDLNIDIVEEDRAADPMGFQQEYLCIPAATEYLFFDVGLLKNAARPGEYQYGWGVGPLAGGEMWMAVDVGIKHDDTVIAVCEHVEQDRYLRYIEVVDENSLRASGIPDPDRSNINHIVRRIGDVFRANQCDRVILDATGNGEWFPVQVAREVSGSMIPFNFSDTKATRDMFLGMNLGLHNGNVYLPDDEQLFAQLASITRIQKEDRHVPKFSGKEHAPDGKDDMAIATVMACYPPGFNHGAEPSVAGKEWDKHEHYPAADDQGHLFAPAVRSGGGAGSTRAAFSGKINRSSGRRKYRSRYAR
jgi:phage FluMu gp28-like protein